MNATYNPQAYWEERLQYHFNLSGVGHLSYSESYNAWLYKRKANALARVLDGVELAGRTVLDIGCGTGFFVREYVSRCARVHGVDITSVSVSRLAGSSRSPASHRLTSRARVLSSTIRHLTSSAYGTSCTTSWMTKPSRARFGTS